MHMEKARKLENTEPFYVTQFINLDCRSQSQMSNSKEALLVGDPPPSLIVCRMRFLPVFASRNAVLPLSTTPTMP